MRLVFEGREAHSAGMQLITEPQAGSPSTVMQVLKQRSAHALLPKRKGRDPLQRELLQEEPQRAFWQARFYDPSTSLRISAAG